MRMGIVLAFVSAAGYGASDFVGGLTARRASPWAVALAGQLAGGVAMLAVGLSLPGQAPRTGAAADAWRDFNYSTGR
jgi:hypothetical protein